MGTNYYLHEPKCEHCGHEPQPLHIGKSSGGWCFSLHAIPEKGINDLPAWRSFFHGGEIRDEYSAVISPEEMESIITERKWGKSKYDPSFLESNGAQQGPNGLLRHKIGRHCIAHGPEHGT